MRVILSSGRITFFCPHRRSLIFPQLRNDRARSIPLQCKSKIVEDIRIKQRKVGSGLGKNNARCHDLIYKEIEEKEGKTKECRFGIRGNKFGIIHQGERHVPVRGFELRLKYVQVDDDGHDTKITITGKGTSLQSMCKICSKRNREARISFNSNRFHHLSDEQCRNEYRKTYGINTKQCSKCKNDLSIDMFNISKTMECGLHNYCKTCMRSYGSSCNDRVIIYMPDGNFKYTKSTNDSSKHDDHIFPLSLGGSDHACNHQFLDAMENLTKSNDLKHFQNIEYIDPLMVSERFRHLLMECNNLDDLKIRLSEEMYKDIIHRHHLSDEELYNIYVDLFKNNNRKNNANRAVKKFRQYVEERYKS